MEIFNLTFSQMLVVFIFMLVGYLLTKKKIVAENTYANLSRMELYIFSPALNLYNQMNNCTVENLKENAVLILYGALIVVVVGILSGPLSKLLVRDYRENRENEYKRNVFKYALALANYGFIGNFIVLEIWGQEMLFKYSMFTFGLTLFTYTWGLYTLIPKDRNTGLIKNVLKGIFSPPMIAMVTGMVIGLFGLTQHVPRFVTSVLSNASDCMGPIAMLLAGMVLGNYDLKELFKNKNIYIMSLLRLIVIPSVIVLVLKVFGTSDLVITLALIAFAAPSGLNTVVFPAAYGGDTKPGAAMTLISSLFSVVTMPLMYCLFVVLW